MTKYLPIILKPDRHECILENMTQTMIYFSLLEYIKSGENIAQTSFEFSIEMRRSVLRKGRLSIDEKIALCMHWMKKKGINYYTKKREYKERDHLDLLIYDGLLYLGNSLIYDKEMYIDSEKWYKIYGKLLDEKQEWVQEVIISLTSSKSKFQIYKNILTQDQIRFYKNILRFCFSEDYPNISGHKMRKSILHIPEDTEVDRCIQVILKNM